ncbi:MAG: alkaline phosphatase family protein [Planctomycetes bacterium]|nr:alkaline phosphatase family protein [Planctomycetota bacterium]
MRLHRYLAVLCLAALAACDDSGPKARAAKVLFIGVDGATWDIAGPMMERGELPNLKALADRGFVAPLETFQPSLSPVIWTTIATGKTKEQHGITDFVHGTAHGTEPVLSNDRRVRAIWDLLGERDVRVGIVGWWLTWPAEVVNGFMVSSLSVLEAGLWKGSAYVGMPRQIHPAAWSADLDRLVEAEQKRAPETARALFGNLPAGFGTAMQKRVILDTESALLSDQIFFESAKSCSRREPVAFLAVYCGIVDVASHRMWRYLRPKDKPQWDVPLADVDALGDVIPAAYRWVDRKIGELVAQADADTLILVASDHGFHAEMRPAMSDEERSGGHEFALLPGIFVAAGPGVRKADLRRDATAKLPSVYDLTPTVLHVFGLPRATDMEGHVYVELFTSEWSAAHALVPEIATYETSPRPTVAITAEERAAVAGAKDDILERLKSLGYLGGK